ncbi:MAG: hypothetical protein Satyrvirus4_4 [Satyrvirus sp.]|uniref:Uncharacterized protein n=1 Tax=Satyrvirus sp. TaxID=2487771 RepID=A0A3G5AD67_9VIRU|nr:MAG: hypothetical protein Satyrvirus4_4 [Satyrvirus sp.]
MTPLFNKTDEKIYCMFCSPEIVDFQLCKIEEDCCKKSLYTPNLMKSLFDSDYNKNLSELNRICDLKAAAIRSKRKPPIKMSNMVNGYTHTELEDDGEFRIMGFMCELCNDYDKYYILIDSEGNLFTHENTIDVENLIVICYECITLRGFKDEQIGYFLYCHGLNNNINNKTNDSTRIAQICEFKKKLKKNN